MNRMRDDLRRDAYKDTEELEREIAATRAELRETLERLEYKLNPKARTRDMAGGFGQRVKENPVPALLTSIGLVWMMTASGRHHNGHGMSRSSSRMYRSPGMYEESDGRMHESTSHLRESADRLKERLRSAKEAVKHRSDSARENLSGTQSRMSSSASSVKQRARGMSSAARQRAQRAQSGMDYLWHEQPLILGAIGLAAGAIAGAALPPTEQEDEALGAIRDRALERAKAAGMQSARQARDRTLERVKASGADNAKHAGERVQHAADALKDKFTSDGDGRKQQSSAPYSSSAPSSSSSLAGEHRNPEQNRDQRVEPNQSTSTGSSSSPGTPLKY